MGSFSLPFRDKSTTSHWIGAWAASKISTTLSNTSGPMPSPGIDVTRIEANRVSALDSIFFYRIEKIVFSRIICVPLLFFPDISHQFLLI